MSKKSLYKVLGLILAVVLVVPVLPAKIIKAAENPGKNLAKEEAVVSPAAITAMAEEVNTTLNLMEGIITVTDQSYVQKTSSGAIVSQGDIAGELILTGIQPNAWDVTLNGINIPTIRFKNASLEGAIKGNFTCALNLIIEGECSFRNLISPANTIPKINVTGEEDCLLKGSPIISLTNMNTDIIVSNLTFNSGDYQTSINSKGNIIIKDCNSLQTKVFYTYVNDSTKTLTLEDSNFENLSISTSSNLIIDNVTVRGGTGSLAAYGGGTIKDSTLHLSSIEFRGTLTKVLDSTIYLHYKGSAIKSYSTVSLSGSTITDSSNNAYNWIIYSYANLIIDDCSIILKGAKTSTNRFYSGDAKAIVDPINSGNKPLFLNKLKVPGASVSYVTVSVDGRDTVNLGTDTDGYLYLYLPTGDHTVKVSDKNGNDYEKTFTAIETRETSSNSNIAGELEPAKESADIKTPYINAELQYSFDNSNWNNAVTDEAGYFKTVIPDNAVRIYSKLVENGEYKYAIISDGTVGQFYDDKPIITEQSSSNLTIKKGLPGTIYVTSKPYITGDTLTYQWHKDGELLSGKTSPVLHLPIPQVSDAGTYTCIITESDGRMITSIPITVTIDESQPEEEGELSIISQSSNKTLIIGYSTELYVNAKPSLSTKELTYQWYKDGEKVSGAVDNKLNLNSVVPEDSGSYVCRVYEDSKYLDSGPILVTVENNPLEDDVTDLNNQVLDLTSQAGALTDQLNTANQDKETLQDTINSLESQIESDTGQISDLQGNITELGQELQDANGDKEVLNQTITDLNNQITGLNDQILSLQADIEAANEDKETLEETVAGLQIDIINLNGHIILLQGKLSDSEEANTGLSDQVTELHSTISGLETGITNLQSELDTLNETNTNLKGQLDAANNTISSLNALLVIIKSELGVANDDEIIPAIQQVKAQLQQETAKNSLLQGQLGELNEELHTATDNNSTLAGKLQELMNLAGSEDTDGIKDKIIELQNKLIDSETQITELEQVKNDLISDLEEAEQLNRSLQQRIDELLALSGSDGEELKRQILDLTDEINQMILNNHKLRESIDNLNAQITEINTEKTVLESEIVRLETLLDSANSTIDELRQELADLAAGKSGLENENAAMKAEIEKLKQQLESNNHSGSGNSGSSNNSAEVKELQDKLNQALSDLENTKTELEKLEENASDTGGTDTGDMEIKIPENSVVILPVEKADEPVIKESADKLITEDKITAEDGWEITPTLDSGWAKEINLVDAVGQTNQEEQVDFSFYAREEDKPEQVYNQTVKVEKPVAIPNFTMDKLIYIGSEFKLKVMNIPTNSKLVYESADSSIAKINKTGIITPVKAGATKITGTVNKGGIPYQFTVKVTVKEGTHKSLNLKDQTVQTSSNEPVLVVYKLVNKGKTTKIDLNGYADNATVSYISTDSNIASVNEKGIIKGVNKGNTTINVTLAQNNTIYTYIIKVRVDDGTIDDAMWDYLTAA
ncbi:MAG: Ig-like domain-containing protein [Anaerocolumna sp.]